MPSNRSNSERGKAFDIDTKIEYMNKLYEVRESNSCCDCSLNTRRGFRTIYYLMRLSQHDMTTVIKDIIAVRHACINFIRNVCDKLEKEDDYILQYLLRGG